MATSAVGDILHTDLKDTYRTAVSELVYDSFAVGWVFKTHDVVEVATDELDLFGGKEKWEVWRICLDTLTWMMNQHVLIKTADGWRL